MTPPRITCLLHSHATVAALIKSAAGASLTGDVLIECSRRPSLGLALSLETPSNYPGVAGLLGGIDPESLAHSADGLPAPIILAAGEEVSVDALRSSLALLRKPDARLGHITLLVPIGAARALGAALAVADRFAIAWDIAQFPHEELIDFARWLASEKLIERDNFIGVLTYGAESADVAHSQKIAALIGSLAAR